MAICICVDVLDMINGDSKLFLRKSGHSVEISWKKIEAVLKILKLMVEHSPSAPFNYEKLRVVLTVTGSAFSLIKFILKLAFL